MATPDRNHPTDPRAGTWQEEEATDGGDDVIPPGSQKPEPSVSAAQPVLRPEPRSLQIKAAIHDDSKDDE
jgi:hypothetical protein